MKMVASELGCQNAALSLQTQLRSGGWEASLERTYSRAIGDLPAHTTFTITADNNGFRHILAFFSAWDATPLVPAHWHFEYARVSAPGKSDEKFTHLDSLLAHLRITTPGSRQVWVAIYLAPDAPWGQEIITVTSERPASVPPEARVYRGTLDGRVERIMERWQP